MFWVAFQGYNNGNPISLGVAEEAEARVYGMHGYPTAAQAKANPNIVPAIAKAQVNAWVFNEQGTATQHLAGHVPVVGAAQSAVTNVNDFLSRLTSGNTWLRIGEFILGALLLLAGAMHLSGRNADLSDLAKLAVPK